MGLTGPSGTGFFASSLRSRCLPERGGLEHGHCLRPRLHCDDRLLLLALVRLTDRWRDALHLVSPETLLRWHRDLFKIVWRRKSRPKRRTSRLAPEIITLIQTMATDNVLWGAERIRGELLKLEHPSQQAHNSEVHEAGPSAGEARSDLEHVHQEPRP